MAAREIINEDKVPNADRDMRKPTGTVPGEASVESVMTPREVESA